ncbi:MAG TPA: 1,2-phenylacetyl-CoA epoxidase subunit PaaD [Puia sp.]|nr:1,2-phenylacetyl-CoA epoxidase subunit PaaD [Puia sp.]
MISKEKIWDLMNQVMDPEVPVLSVVDLGIVRDVRMQGEKVEVDVTPTYSGCPAMDVIRMNIRMVLIENGVKNVSLNTVISPAWTTDWMSEEGKAKLQAFGIAPPTIKQQVCHTELFHEGEAIQCPHCGSYNTRVISQFGSTACKALYVCDNCREPFDYFKCH